MMATFEEVIAVTVTMFCGCEMPEYPHFSEILNGGDKSEAFDAVDRQCSSE
jgi:hypothetical protein